MLLPDVFLGKLVSPTFLSSMSSFSLTAILYLCLYLRDTANEVEELD